MRLEAIPIFYFSMIDVYILALKYFVLKLFFPKQSKIVVATTIQIMIIIIQFLTYVPNKEPNYKFSMNTNYKIKNKKSTATYQYKLMAEFTSSPAAR
jgi:hypothetical protein